MAELWDLRDEFERPTGKQITRGDPIPPGYWHIVVTIWTVTADGRLLLTRRHPDKHWALLWESTAGSVQAGETSREGALRELREETGLEAEADRFRLLSSEKTDRLFLDTYLYLCPEQEPALRLQPEEVGTPASFPPRRSRTGSRIWRLPPWPGTGMTGRRSRRPPPPAGKRPGTKHDGQII